MSHPSDPRAKLPDAPPADNERLKGESHYLEGSISNDLVDGLSGGFRGDNFQLIRFHGMYEQDDRDIRAEHDEKGDDAGDQASGRHSARMRIGARRIGDGAAVHHGDQALEIAGLQKISLGITKKSTLSLSKSLC